VLEVASRRDGPVGLDDAIVRLAIEEQPTSRKLFRRIDTVSEADVKGAGADESIFKRLSRLQRVEGADIERRSADQKHMGSTERESREVEYHLRKRRAEEAFSQLENGQETSDVLASTSQLATIFQATEASVKAAKRPSLEGRSSKQRSSEAHGRSEEEVLGEGLRKGRQQELL
jgi:hypothetical protein